MKLRRAGIVFGIAFALLLVMPAPTHAASATFFGPIVPAECHCDKQNIVGGGGSITSAPDYGCVLQVIQNLINFSITLSTILFTLYLVLTGFAFMTSGGSSEARSKAKTRFTNVFVGLAVLLCSWLIVDYVMKTLYNEKSFGPWNAILADNSTTSRCIIAKQSTAISAGSIATGLVSAPSSSGSEPGTGTADTSGGGYTGNGFTYQANVQKQVPMESGALGNLLGCMATHVPAGVGQISAITEQAIANGSKTMQQCATSGCAHTANSCHYGGTGSCVGKAYAVDFGDENNAAALRAAAKACNPDARYNFEGDHVHISIGAASGCSCDASMTRA